MAARVAHELCNSVAAVLVTLCNLCEELITDDKRQRIDQMIRELSFIPQGGGDCYRTHRCPAEGIVINLIEHALDFFTRRVHYLVPARDLLINYRCMLALPCSRFVIENIQVVETGMVDFATLQ